MFTNPLNSLVLVLIPLKFLIGETMSLNLMKVVMPHLQFNALWKKRGRKALSFSLETITHSTQMKGSKVVFH